MRKLSAQVLSEIETAVFKLETAKADLEEAKEKLETEIESRVDDINQAIQDFNEWLDEGTIEGEAESVTEACQEIYQILDSASSSAENYFDERSEKWQEGDKGDAHQAWAEMLREKADSCEVEVEVSVERMSELDLPDVEIENDSPDQEDFLDIQEEPEC